MLPPDFFDPNSHSSALFSMGGAGHLVLALMLLGVLAAMTLFRKELWRLRASRAFMAGTAGVVLSFELLATLFTFIYPCEPALRIPLHLCASLKIVIAILVLLERYDLVKYVAVTAIGCGFISFANLNMGGGSFENFGFWHYVVGHLYLFALPLFLFLTGEHRFDLPHHVRAMGGLFTWSLIIFFVNWAFDTNYMYSGPHNETVVALIPARLMEWPGNYGCYLAVGFVLLNSVYALLTFTQRRMNRGHLLVVIPREPARMGAC
jgi:hypothetical integral membrane protein (TIGR02206 family)